MSLEKLDIGHVPFLNQIHAECFEEAWPDFSDFFTNEAWGNMEGWIALEKGGKALGFILVRDLQESCEIITFAVRPSCQRGGVGTCLLEKLVSDKKCPLFLEVSPKNISALNLYQKAGFKILGERPGYYQGKAGQRENAYLMGLNVPSV